MPKYLRGSGTSYQEELDEWITKTNKVLTALREGLLKASDLDWEAIDQVLTRYQISTRSDLHRLMGYIGLGEYKISPLCFLMEHLRNQIERLLWNEQEVIKGGIDPQKAFNELKGYLNGFECFNVLSDI